MTEYRDRIYPQYASAMQTATHTFDEKSARSWGVPYQFYLRGWLPSSRSGAILEVACGGGRLLHALKTWGYARLEGIDLSPEQVALSRQVLPSDQVHEAEAIGFLASRPGQYDLILGLDLIEHLRKDEVLNFLDAAFRALRPGGRLVLQTPNAASPFFGEWFCGDFTHETGFSPGGLQKLLILAGFSECEARELGPVPHGLLSFVRALAWKVLRFGIKAWNLVETGAAGCGVHTRVMLVSGRVPGGE